jgi:hypothetical protein
MLARNALFAWLAACAASFSFARLFHLLALGGVAQVDHDALDRRVVEQVVQRGFDNARGAIGMARHQFQAVADGRLACRATSRNAFGEPFAHRPPPMRGKAVLADILHSPGVMPSTLARRTGWHTAPWPVASKMATTSVVLSMSDRKYISRRARTSSACFRRVFARRHFAHHGLEASRQLAQFIWRAAPRPQLPPRVRSFRQPLPR